MTRTTIIKVQHRRTRLFLARNTKGFRWVRTESEAEEFPTELYAQMMVRKHTATDPHDVWFLPRLERLKEAA